MAQSPPGCIVATEFTPHLKPPLVDFDIVQEYIIPRKAFFNRLDVDQIPYERLVRRLAVTFAEMERQNGYLSTEGEVDDGLRPIGSLLEIVKEDLNNYGECMIPVGELLLS